jgi:hypothetical protein
MITLGPMVLTITWNQSRMPKFVLSLVNLFQIIHAKFLLSHLFLLIRLISIMIMSTVAGMIN